jgi:DNA gyrase, B subunit
VKILVGASCVNAVSENFSLYINQNNKKYNAEFSKGIITQRLKVVPFEKDESKDSGTTVMFKLDKELWTIEEYDISHIKKRLRQLSYLNPGLTIKFSLLEKDAEEFKEETFHCPEGLIGYVNKISTGKQKLIDIVEMNKNLVYASTTDNQEKTVDVDIALVYTDTYSSDVKSFVNNVATERGGDHETGFKMGLNSAIKKYIDEYKPKGIKNIESTDSLEGLLTIISIKLKDPNFKGQDKSNLGMLEIRHSIKTFVEDFIYDYLCKDEKRTKIILEKIAQAAKAREAAKRARNAARGIKNATASGYVEDLAPCSNKDPEQCEIFFVEGDSAAGTCKQARNNKFQAILPVFGKILNAEKSSHDKIIGSSKLVDMIKVLGCGIGQDFDISKLKYHRIILLSDADVD